MRRNASRGGRRAPARGVRRRGEGRAQSRGTDGRGLPSNPPPHLHPLALSAPGHGARGARRYLRRPMRCATDRLSCAAGGKGGRPTGSGAQGSREGWGNQERRARVIGGTPTRRGLLDPRASAPALWPRLPLAPRTWGVVCPANGPAAAAAAAAAASRLACSYCERSRPREGRGPPAQPRRRRARRPQQRGAPEQRQHRAAASGAA
jgi:hypothetical protein